MKRVFYVVFVVVFTFCSTCKKQLDKEVAIYGFVVASGEPVNAAAILLTPGGGVKITGSDGLYEFSGLEPGKYEIKVFKEGFLSFNQSIDASDGKDKEITPILIPIAGSLSINKAYIDMGSNESNNIAGFTLINNGDDELTWKVSNAAGWITNIDPANGIVSAKGQEGVTIKIDRSRLSTNIVENYATLVVLSSTDGSVAELLVTVFGTGDGTNITISNEPFVIIDGLFVQTNDIGGLMRLYNAKLTCESSAVGNYNDWRLPTIGELALLYTKRYAIGGFHLEPSGGTYDNTGYWSCTGSDVSSAYMIIFYNGNQYYSNNQFRCRCVRESKPLPIVSTLSVTNISTNAATLNGRIDNQGEPAFTERGFVFSHIFQNPTVETDEYTIKRVVPGTSTDFSSHVEGLTAEQTYFVRAFATNRNGTAYGESISFKPTSD
ncbi:MAG: DUF1566 domain-containing protein [Marinilabiliaceae bacterium]|nr:DUF1566 domain-containing protein [Marinilabiliaceae bacterium]